jgi:hypothetical protein
VSKARKQAIVWFTQVLDYGNVCWLKVGSLGFSEPVMKVQLCQQTELHGEVNNNAIEQGYEYINENVLTF